MTGGDFALTSPVPVGGRESHDHYPTPRWCTEALIAGAKFLRPDVWRPVDVVLDPACGEGAILDVFRGLRTETPGLEIDPLRAEAARARGHQVRVCDALEHPWPEASVCAMNPPYLLAERFVRKALAWREASGSPVFALLRLSWLEPAGTRGALFRDHPPDVLILPRRPAFDGRGTDSTTSAWFCWPGTGRLVWLPP